MSDPLRFDLRGRFHRCAHCGWLDERTHSHCLQCGRAAEPPRWTSVPIELQIVRSRGALQERSLDHIQRIRDALAARPAVRLTPIAHQALVKLDGRLLLVAPDAQRRREAAREILAAIASIRGELTLWSDEPITDASERIQPVTALADAHVAVVARALALPHAQRAALAAVRWLIVSDPAPLCQSLHSLYELVAMTRPELARTRRAFLSRFNGAHRTAVTQAALGSLLARVVLRVSPEVPLPPELALLDRWLDAAPRS